MSFVVKAHSASDLDKPPAYDVVSDQEVILQDRQQSIMSP